jgi:uncharacterized membrane-anchored protein
MRHILALFLLVPALACAQNVGDELRKLKWQAGPAEGRISDKATIKVPAGYVFLDEPNTSRFIELAGNPPRSGHYLFAPESLEWWSVFTFDPVGYVKDDEKIDAEALLKNMKDSDAAGNEQRRKLGMAEIFTVGWEVPPHYDAGTKRLEWGLRLRNAQGGESINYTSRLLGRSGVMSAILVAKPASLAADTQAFRANLNDFSYAAGERYAEFKQGDRIAEIGLAALIVGGAAAVATKKGFWAALAAFFGAFWKFILAGLVAVGAALRGLFRKKE